MGTNYYLKSIACKTCGHSQTELHIGKSSMGWKFLFNGNDFYRSNFDSWMEEFKHPNKQIYDENNQKLTLEEFLDIVEKKSEGKCHLDSNFPAFYQDEKGYDFCRNEFC